MKVYVEYWNGNGMVTNLMIEGNETDEITNEMALDIAERLRESDWVHHKMPDVDPILMSTIQVRNITRYVPQD